jgi:hypothetical protein
MAADTPAARPVRHRPRTTTVFVAAFVAGAAAAVGVNRALDVRLAQAKPQVECEPIFVALRDLPAGASVTVWDVALRDLPKAMVPATALRVSDSFEGRLLKFPLRAGQPLISAQLLQPEVAAPVAPTTEPAAQEALVEEAFVPPVPATPVAAEVGDSATDSHETVVTTPTPEPEVTPTPQVAAIEPTPVAAPVEPTPASPLPVEAAPAVNLSSDLFADADANLAADLNATLDMPSRPAVNLADLPSVMARGDTVSAAPATAGEGSGIRYLVVPERIARQVDTAFTTPVAPETAGPAQPNEPSQTTTRPDRGPTERSAAAAVVPPATLKPSEAGRPGRPPALRQQQGRPTSATKQQQARPQPAKSGATSAKPVPGRPGQPTATAAQTTAGPRAWGGMFPNVAAGLEAMGSWRTGGRAAPAQSERDSTTR